MQQILEQLQQIGLVPVIKIEDPAQAEPLAKALMAGGLPCAEVTFRTAGAAKAIRAMKAACPDMLVGAGTVLTTDQADEALEAGAQFIVSPGLNPVVVRHCVDIGVPVTPGCANPSDVERAIELGLEVVKFFPAQAAGGLPMIKSMAAPYGNIKFMPTGGINPDNLVEYLSFPKVIACGGSWMVPEKLLKAGDYAGITQLTRQALDLVLGFEVRHVGVNAGDDPTAQAAAGLFAKLFGFPSLGNNAASVFSGPSIEIMKEGGRGARGHIAIGTNSVTRAEAYLRRLGVRFIEESRQYNEAGQLKLIYLQDEVCGFALHLALK